VDASAADGINPRQADAVGNAFVDGMLCGGNDARASACEDGGSARAHGACCLVGGGENGVPTIRTRGVGCSVYGCCVLQFVFLQENNISF